MDTKKEYIAPELTVVSFKTERGYAASANFKVFSLVQAMLGISSGSMETFDFSETEDALTDGVVWD